MDPQYGCVLTIDSKKQPGTDYKVFKNGTKAVAYFLDLSPTESVVDGMTGAIIEVPRDPGYEVLAEMVQVTEEKGGRLVGIDKLTGEPSTWVVADSEKRCRGCS